MFVVCFTGSGLCDGLITRLGESNCVCVCVPDYIPCRNLNNEASGAVAPQGKKKVATFRPSFCNNLNYSCQYTYDLI